MKGNYGGMRRIIQLSPNGSGRYCSGHLSDRSRPARVKGARMHLLLASKARPQKPYCPQLITSSARTSSVGGKVKPCALAVLRLMISSNFVAW